MRLIEDFHELPDNVRMTGSDIVFFGQIGIDIEELIGNRFSED